MKKYSSSRYSHNSRKRTGTHPPGGVMRCIGRCAAGFDDEGEDVSAAGRSPVSWARSTSTDGGTGGTGLPRQEGYPWRGCVASGRIRATTSAGVADVVLRVFLPVVRRVVVRMLDEVDPVENRAHKMRVRCARAARSRRAPRDGWSCPSRPRTRRPTRGWRRWRCRRRRAPAACRGSPSRSGLRASARKSR